MSEKKKVVNTHTKKKELKITTEMADLRPTEEEIPEVAMDGLDPEDVVPEEVLNHEDEAGIPEFVADISFRERFDALEVKAREKNNTSTLELLVLIDHLARKLGI